MARKCNSETVKILENVNNNLENCIKEEHLITPNEYSNFFDLDTVPPNFTQLIELALLTLNSKLINRTINKNSKTSLCWNNLKKAIFYQIKHIDKNRTWFDMEEIYYKEEELTEVKIGDFSYKMGDKNKINKISYNKNIISPISLTYLRQCGWLMRVL